MSEQQPLIEAPKKKTGLFVGIAIVVIALIAGAVFALTRGGDDDVVRIGVVGASDPYWDTYVKAAKDEGINVEIKDFSEYSMPNPALADGDIEVNQFQHIVFLAEHNEKTGDDLKPIGSTAIYPLTLHSEKYKSVEEIPAGETIAVPDDVSNRARALLILQSAGLIELKDGGTIFSDPTQVDAEKSKVKVIEMTAANTPTALKDTAGAVVNNDFVQKAGLSFDDALAQDDPTDPNALPYVNVFAVRSDDVDNETYRKLVEIYHGSEDVLKGLQEVSGGSANIVDLPAKDLQASLDKVIADIKAQG